MATVQILTDDLLFGSRLEAEFAAAGHTAVLGTSPREGVDAVVADLTHDADQRIAALGQPRPPVLAFYSHVENAVRERALAAGLELVVPRSRIAREGAVLLASLLARAR